MAAPGKLGALSTILWLLVLFGGYLEAVSTRSFRSFQRPYEDILAQMCHSGDIWGLSGSFGSIGANFGAIYVFNRLFGAVGVNGGSQDYLGVYWGYSCTILVLLWLHQASLGLSVLYCGYQCYLEAIWGLSVLFGGH